MIPVLGSFALATVHLPKAVAVMRQLDQGQKLICSGVPLTPKITLTAGHCVPRSSPNEKQNPTVNLSILNPEESSMRTKVLRWIVHPQFRETPQSNLEDFDLALIESENLMMSQPLLSNRQTAFSPIDFSRLAGLWLAGFSPTRLGSESPEVLLRSKSAWSQIDKTQSFPLEGKFLARAQAVNKAAACPGDSGAPVWNFQNTQPELIGLVVQANCEKGDVKIVDLSRYASWIQDTAFKLSYHPMFPAKTP